MLQLPKYALAAFWQKKLTKNVNSKFWSQRVPERQHRQDNIDKQTHFLYMFGHIIHFEMKSF